MLLRDILDSKMARVGNTTNNRELISNMCNAVTEVIIKNNAQIERDLTITETDDHCC
jgi:hypothetical protein